MENFTKEDILQATVRRFNGTNKTILQFSTSGEFIEEFISAAEASKKLGCNCSTIGKAASKSPHAKGYLWIYKKEFSKSLLDKK